MGGGGNKGGGAPQIVYTDEYWDAMAQKDQLEAYLKAQNLVNTQQRVYDAASEGFGIARDAVNAQNTAFDKMQVGFSATSADAAKSNLAQQNAMRAASDIATAQAQSAKGVVGGTGSAYNPDQARISALANIGAGAGTAMASQGGVAGPASALSGTNTASITPNTGAPRAAAKYASMQEEDAAKNKSAGSTQAKFGGS